MKEKILSLRNKGYSYNQIVEELGCSKGTVAYYCGAGQRDKNLQRQRDRRNKKIKYIQEYKQRKGCADCKENYPYWMLQFDHLSDKSFTISTGKSDYTLERIIVEIEKCDVVCANCHANRTHFRLLKSAGDTYDIAEHYLEGRGEGSPSSPENY